MTATLAPTQVGPAEQPTLRSRWRRWRVPLAIVTVMIVTAIVVALVDSQSRRGYLDPRGVDPSGSRALVEILRTQGVQVADIRRADAALDAAGPDTTVLITVPDLVADEALDGLLGSGADIVAVDAAFTTISPDVGPGATQFAQTREPGCDLREAVRAGTARLGGGYTVEGDATVCYDGTLVVTSGADGQRLVLLGSPDPLTNRFLADDGNAALAMGLLGHHRELIWYRPLVGDAMEAPATLTELLPGWVIPAAWQLGIAALLAAWWRARRLGRLVPEPLPVIVRAAEATEGRARLYRRGRARGHAADTLREAAVQRLRGRLGLPPEADVTAVAAAVADRTGRAGTDVEAILAGPPPTDDPALVRLADDLDRLEQEVRNL